MGMPPPILPTSVPYEVREYLRRLNENFSRLDRDIKQLKINLPSSIEREEPLERVILERTQVIGLGQLSQGQFTFAPVVLALPLEGDPLRQNGQIVFLSSGGSYLVYVFDGTVEPGVWRLAGSSGTVTSFSAIPSSIFDVANPTTTPALSLDNQNANLFLAGPLSGAAATPSFRVISSLDTVSVTPTILSTTTLNLNTNTKQTLYTVPLGRGAIILMVVLRQASVDLSTGITTFLTFGFNAGANDWSPTNNFPTTGFTSSLLYSIQDQYVASGGQQVSFGGSGAVFGAITDNSFGSASNVVVDVIGYLF